MAVIDLPDRQRDVKRARVFMVGILIGLTAILARLWYLQVAHGPELAEKSIENQLRLIRRVPPRGVIQDRRGRVLATNRHQIVVSVVPDELTKNPGEVPILASILGMSPVDLAKAIEDGKTNEFDPVRVAQDIPIDVATRLEEQRFNLPGVYVAPEPVRYYPDGPLCGHILGQMGEIPPGELKERKAEGYRPGDHCGSLGLEKQYDSDLRGENGGREIWVDARGRLRREVSDLEPVPGATLTLALDKDLQKIAYDGLAAWAAKGKPGAVVALDPQTGAVLTLASVPSYDPNQFVMGISKANWKRLAADPLLPQVNRAVGSAYAPGSTFKVITSMAGLETGKATPNTTAYCSGVMMLGRWAKHCHKSGGHGSVNLTEAIAKSCDVFFYHLGMNLGPDDMARYARRFGLGKPLGIDLPHVEASGLVPDTKWLEKKRRSNPKWMGGEIVDYAIGQAMLKCTPLQMCGVAAALGNGGTIYQPQLVRTVTAWDRQGQPHVLHTLKPKVVGHLGVSPEHIGVVVNGMRQVMLPGGTASTQGVPGLSIAGKTGTAQMREHGEMKNNAWFIGFAPAEHPRIAICVFIQGGGHGGTVSAPIARQMFARYFGIKLQGSATENGND